MIDVLIVDDQPLVRAGISMLLMAEDDIRVIGEAGSGQQALQLARSSCPDVVLMDVRMPGMDGVAATRELVRESKGNPDRLVRVLIMTTFDDEDVVVQALQAGASGYLLKHASPTEIADAIRRVAAGDTWLDATAATRLVQRLRASSAVPTDITEVLTPREQEVLRLVAAGLSNQEIRDTLVLSEATVKTHVARILFKTGARDRAAVVAQAYRSGFVHPDDPVPA
ncbi:response regulator transcription factor [Glutamicibacter sp. V16R2B1]|uniref:response regulator n=1 Tax=Glutamicibacter sp. V16R2B1 TaxID=2036207 RepID=UPI0010FD1580|nr:response regulator transcription factor [Glutamicibacter sp. V16R2B1]TLK57092.1 response regulator transcription factor [Glutamicibacter sp. V16R2B1]